MKKIEKLKMEDTEVREIQKGMEENGLFESMVEKKHCGENEGENWKVEKN